MRRPPEPSLLCPHVCLARPRVCLRTQGSSPGQKMLLPSAGLEWDGKTLGHTTYLDGRERWRRLPWLPPWGACQISPTLFVQRRSLPLECYTLHRWTLRHPEFKGQCLDPVPLTPGP